MRANGLGWIACVRILPELFNLSLEGAKEVTVVADDIATSLGEHEALRNERTPRKGYATRPGGCDDGSSRSFATSSTPESRGDASGLPGENT
jgi:hypothetical protein